MTRLVRVNPSTFRKNLFDILPPVEHTHDFRPIVFQTIEHNLGAGGERAKTRPDFIARPACKRKIVNGRNNPGHFAQDVVSGVTRPAVPA
jgi:hypothetical protein